MDHNYIIKTNNDASIEPKDSIESLRSRVVSLTGRVCVCGGILEKQRYYFYQIWMNIINAGEYISNFDTLAAALNCIFDVYADDNHNDELRLDSLKQCIPMLEESKKILEKNNSEDIDSMAELLLNLKTFEKYKKKKKTNLKKKHSENISKKNHSIIYIKTDK
eukprot:GHVR01117434.1.p1 GENE.GHVR01117434.1~~GHVR01117434.1.p1  ORF type:complete len:163 (+),score=39.29 GHVR01117434.1:951-1439(+)